MQRETKAGIADLPEEDLETGWDILEEGWWRISFRDVSWSYSYFDPSGERGSRPTFYHGSPLLSLDNPSGGNRATTADDEDNELSQELLAVKCTSDVIWQYELNVGFYANHHSKSDPSSTSTLSVVTDSRADVHRKSSHDLIQDLTGGPRESRGIDELSLLNFCLHDGPTPPTPSCVDLSDSDHSILSLPSTPKAREHDDNLIIQSNDREWLELGPRCHTDALCTGNLHPLVTDAVSSLKGVVPPPSPDSKTAMTNSSSQAFPFPSPDLKGSGRTYSTIKCVRQPVVVLQKDQHGFWNEVKLPSSPSISGRHVLTDPSSPSLQGPSDQYFFTESGRLCSGAEVTLPKAETSGNLPGAPEDKVQAKDLISKNLFLALGRPRLLPTSGDRAPPGMGRPSPPLSLSSRSIGEKGDSWMMVPLQTPSHPKIGPSTGSHPPAVLPPPWIYFDSYAYAPWQTRMQMLQQAHMLDMAQRGLIGHPMFPVPAPSVMHSASQTQPNPFSFPNASRGINGMSGVMHSVW